ncbi:MAG: bifunctional biotin--[acetyl-CoA-carboxylase] ligase/biotin operon repressor BirA [Rickettsiales bacterium]|nr:bifunctional biotin--[acetyl-CoA-carboxylase] ligase/biotin operon repressor BirA [Rickettsiales bacterium]
MQKKQNTNLVEIVKCLSGKVPVSGNNIAQKLNISRSAVWKAIKKLQSYGILIKSHKNGYYLDEELVLLSPQSIISNLGNIQKINLEIFETIDSTNQYYLDNHVDHNTTHVCLAEYQSNGKGRLGRTWTSPFGQNLYLSICTFIDTDLSTLGGLSLVVSLAIAKTLKTLTQDDEIKVKWPNDVIYKKQKLSGSLIQLISEQNGLCKIIIGVGINVNMIKSQSIDIKQDWCSIRNIINQSINRNIVAAKLITNILDYFNIFRKNGFEYFIDEWEKTDCFFGREVSLYNNEQTITGIEKGVNRNGQILLSTNGLTTAYSCGETTFSKHH